MTDRTPRKDPAGVVLGTGTAGVFGALAAWLCTLGGLWPLAAAPAALLAVVGLAATVRALEVRDRTRPPRDTDF